MMMKKFLPLLILGAAVVVPVLFTPSCANTTDAPTGGKKDTIPPFIVDIKPLPGTVAVPVKDTRIVFTFNEYVAVKNPKSIYLSPPQEKAPKSKISGKSVIVYFEEDLLPNTTYTIDLNDAIADANESNPFAGFTYVFSTGERIDSMYVTGSVQDYSTLKPVKGATVMLYKDHADSAVFLKRPCAAAITDEWGYFKIPYIQDTLYRIYAIKDETGNNIYDPDTDLVGFVDSIISPKQHVRDSVYELMYFNMKDTAECLARKVEYKMNLFREMPSKQYIVNKERTAARAAYVTFQAPGAWIDSLWIKGYRSDRIISQFNIMQDSLELWVNDRRPAPDTLRLYVSYRKTDSLGHLQPVVENFRLALPPELRVKAHTRREIKHEDTICVYKLEVAPETVEQEGFSLEFKYPIIRQCFDSLRLRIVNPKMKESFAKVEVRQDSLNLRVYHITPNVKYQKGYEYFLKLPHRGFRDINGFYSDSTETKVTLPTDEDLSIMKLNFSNVDRRLIVDLMDEKRSQTLRTYNIHKDCTLEFPYLKEGKYSIRITVDTNGNSIVDTGSLLEHRQCEPVFFLMFEKNDYLDVPKAVELEQAADLKKILSL